MAAGLTLAGSNSAEAAEPAAPAAATPTPTPTTAPSEADREQARDAYNAGKAAFEAGEFAQAAEHFTKANTTIGSPHALYWIAISFDKAGMALEAREAYSAFLGDAGHDKLGGDKVTEAQIRLGELERAPGEFTLSVVPPAAKVEVDGEAQMGSTPFTLKLDPGGHRIVIRADGYKTRELDVTITAHSKQRSAVVLDASEAAEAPPAAEPTAKAEPKSNIPAYVTLGVAGASAIAGTIFGIRALSAKDTYNSDPTQSHLDDVERNALIADMAFGFTITLGITGVVLLTAGGDEGQAQASKAEDRATLQLAPYASKRGGGAAARMTF